MNKIKRVLTDPNHPPVVLIPPNSLDELATQVMANEMGFQFIKISGSAISSKEDLFVHLSSAFHFPDYFGRNWDAALDCIRDLDSWLPAKGYLVLFKNPNNLISKSLSDFKAFLEIAEAASEFWASQGVRFILIVEGKGDLKKLLAD